MNKHTKWFRNKEFITKATGEVFNKPFWIEEDNVPVPYPSSSGAQQIVNECVSIYQDVTLPAFGFRQLDLGNGYVPVQLVGNLAIEVDEFYIKDYICHVLSLMPNGKKIVDAMTQKYDRFFSRRMLTCLRRDANCKPFRDNRSTAYRFYRNGIVKIKSDSCVLISYEDLPEDNFVWASQIIDRDFDPDLVGEFDKDQFVSDLTQKPGNHFHKWCQNLCKIQDVDDQSAWIYDPKKFKSLVSGFGYLLHQNWNEYKCVVLVDADLQSGEANGRTGKSVVLDDALAAALNSTTIEADQVKTGDSNKFLFHNVGRDTQYICLDDACNDFPFNTLFAKITGSFTCEMKYGGIFQFPKNRKPKLGLTTNHPLKGEGSSYIDRQHIVEVGGFYRFHKMELGKDPHTTFHDGWLFDEEWSDTNWKEFDAFCVKALRFYLSEGLLGGKSTSNYKLRKLQSSVGCNQLVNTLHLFLETNVGYETYSRYITGMSEEQKGRCLEEFVEEAIPNEQYSPRHLTKSMRLVANHFDFKINVGSQARTQRRFGPSQMAVDAYRITTASNPFMRDGVDSDAPSGPSKDPAPSEWSEEEVLKQFENMDSRFKLEKQLAAEAVNSPALLDPPVRSK